MEDPARRPSRQYVDRATAHRAADYSLIWQLFYMDEARLVNANCSERKKKEKIRELFINFICHRLQ